MKNKRKQRKIMGLAALVLLAAVVFSGCGANKASYGVGIDKVLEKDGEWLENFEPFLRLDNDSATAWQGELENFRVITEGWYELGEAKEKYNLDPNYPIDTDGMDTLNASASGQFSEQQFHRLADTLREVAGEKEIVIVDLREESHYLLNGISISNFKLHNWINLGMPLEEIEKAEAEVFEPLVGQTVTAYVEDDEVKQPEQLEITVESAMSEKELVESEGFTYLRIDCTDHAWPTPEEIDFFIDYTQNVDLENTWFHFHCHAGSGRTGVFMMLFDKMKNPHISTQDIFYRQAKTGSNYPLYLGKPDSYKAPLYAEKAEMAPLLMQYVEEAHEENYTLSWSEWLKDHRG